MLAKVRTSRTTAVIWTAVYAFSTSQNSGIRQDHAWQVSPTPVAFACGMVTSWEWQLKEKNLLFLTIITSLLAWWTGTLSAEWRLKRPWLITVTHACCRTWRRMWRNMSHCHFSLHLTTSHFFHFVKGAKKVEQQLLLIGELTFNSHILDTQSTTK